MDTKLFFKIFFDLFKVSKINYGTSHVLTIAHDIDRNFLYKGKYYSPLIDTIEDDLKLNGINCVSIARIISTIKGDKSYGKVYSPEGRFARALVLKRVKGFFNNNIYPYSHLEENIWHDILSETRARKVLAIMPSRELCVACRKRNIWVADVQHGVIANNHPWYGETFRSKDPINYLPNSFLVWDKGSSEVIEKWVNPKDVNVNIIGNRWLARFLYPSSNDVLVKSTLSDFSKYLASNELDQRPIILFTLSWGQEGLENGIMPLSMINIIRRTSNKYRWLLRLHPNQLKGFASFESKRFFQLFNNHLKGFCEWEIPTKTALPAVMLNINLNIAWFSSVVIEASQYGIRSATLDPRLRGELANDYYDYHRKLGYIDFIENDESIIEKWICDNISIKMVPHDFIFENKNYKTLIDFLISDN